jgi:hypothetical protein
MNADRNRRETLALLVGGAAIACLCLAAVPAGLLLLQRLFGFRLF